MLFNSNNRGHKSHGISLTVFLLNFEHFCEEAQGRDGHGHASDSKETQYDSPSNLLKILLRSHEDFK